MDTSQVSHAMEMSRMVSRQPLGTTSATFRTWALRQPTPDIAEFRPTFQVQAFWLAFGLPGFILLVSAPGILAGQSRGAVLLGAAYLLAASGVLGLMATSGRARLTADRLREWMVIRDGLHILWSHERIIWLQDVAALQICSHQGSGASGGPSHLTYELNLVLKGLPCERVNLVSHANVRCLRYDAEQFATFLAVPLLDHA